MEQIKIHQIVNSVFTSNTFVLMDKRNNAYLVDIGDFEPILQLGVKEIKGVFLTHAHYDHIYGLRELLERFPNCPIYTSEWGVEALASDKLNFSRYHGDPLIIKCENVKVLSERDRIELFDNITLDVFETPGHNRSCLTFKVGNNIFTGDAYIPGIKVVTTLPNANKMDAEASKERIAAMAQGLDLYPGHGDVYLNYICNS